MYFGEILSQLTRIIIRRFLYSEAATFIRFLAFLNLKRQRRTADVAVVVAKSLLPCVFHSLDLLSEKRLKGSMMLVLFSRLLVCQEPTQLISEYTSMKRVCVTSALRDRRYNYFPCRLTKRKKEIWLFANTLLYFLTFIQTWDFFGEIKVKTLGMICVF